MDVPQMEISSVLTRPQATKTVPWNRRAAASASGLDGGPAKGSCFGVREDLQEPPNPFVAMFPP
jgi:hypothetical protein